jgi:hypothetical protein
LVPVFFAGFDDFLVLSVLHVVLEDLVVEAQSLVQHQHALLKLVHFAEHQSVVQIVTRLRRRRTRGRKVGKERRKGKE